MYNIALILQYIESSILSNKFIIGFLSVFVNFSTAHLLNEFSPLLKNFLKYRMFRSLILFCICFMATRDIFSSFLVTCILYLLLDIINTFEKFEIEKILDGSFIHELHDKIRRINPLNFITDQN